MDDHPKKVIKKLLASDSEEKEVHELLYAAVAQLLSLDRNWIPKYFEKVVGTYYSFEFKRLCHLPIETFD